MDIDQGERLYLRVHHGPGGGWCDTTALSFEVDHVVETALVIDPTYDNNADLHADWVDTGVSVTAGRELEITATGLANHLPIQNGMYDADGQGTATGSTMLAEGLALGGLVGKIGNGQPFMVGTNDSLPAGATGTSYLGYNDSRCNDNIGQFDVTIAH